MHYEIRIAGRIDPERAAWFEGVTLTVQKTGEEVFTVLTVATHDQASLFGILARIRDLGIRLISVNPQP